MDVAQTVFPDRKILPVMLDPANPLPPPLEAWTALDAVILTEAVRSRLPEYVLGELLAAGVTIVTPGRDKPDLLQLELRGPRSPISEIAYLPTQSWRPQAPALLRWRVFWLGVMFAVLIILTTLTRPKFATPVGLIICATFAAALLLLWHNTLASVHEAGGSLFVSDGAWTHEDRWVFRNRRRDTSDMISSSFCLYSQASRNFRDAKIRARNASPIAGPWLGFSLKL